MWDIPSDEKYGNLAKIFFANSNIIVLVYDITYKDSFKSLEFWIDLVIEKLGKDVYFILVGNKSDLYDNERISEETAKKFAKIIKANFALVSAKENYFQWNSFFLNEIKNYIEAREKKP